MRDELNALKASMSEAKRFLDKAKALQVKLEAAESPFGCYPLRERSATKRASLDLSSSLAAFRRSRA